jgi:glycerol-1-phosphate dehydrogenase [NAD(P)+]
MHTDVTLDSILDRTIQCRCGQIHKVPIKGIFFSEDALMELPEFLNRHIQVRTAVLISDIRTYEIAGRQVKEILKNAGWSIRTIKLPDGEKGSPVCDDGTFHDLSAQIRNSPGVCIAVGSGVINDLTKWVSFDLDVPYVAVATAASMNGFTAANVAPVINGVKSLVRAHAPFFLSDEPFCSFCAEIINEIEPLYFNNPEGVLKRSPEGIEAIFKALIYSGLAMTMIGSSAPASGGEHLFSHTLDMMSLVDGIPHDLHGRQVGLGTVFAAALYDRLRNVDHPEYREMPDTIDHGFWGKLAEPVDTQYRSKLKNLPEIKDRLTAPDAWDHIRSKLFVKAKSPVLIAECLRKAGAALYLKDIDCSRERARQTVLHLHEIRSRFTVVDLAWMVGVLPDAADDMIDEWLLGDS